MKRMMMSVCVVMSMWTSFGDSGPSVEQVFKIPPVDPQWKALYDQIEGSTHQEKGHHAASTWEMKAVAEISRWETEVVLQETAQKLYSTLDAEGQALMLKTHKAWRAFIQLQAEFVSDDCRGGSARSLFMRDILETEIQRRTQLYEEMLAGRSVAVGDGLSMYH
jgi:uncharacterized protein YecT (DUF1311 family)